MDVDNNEEENEHQGEDANEEVVQEAPAASRRRRVILAPLEDCLLNSRMITHTREISITTLSSDNVYTMNMNRNYIDVQLIRIITPRKEQKAYLYSLRSGRRGGGSKEMHFSRIFQCRVYSAMNSSEHKKIIYLMESKNSNNNMFERNLDFRDNGTISIGTFLRVISPEAIEEYMNGDIPMIRTPCSLIVLKRPTKMPTVAVNYEVQTNQSLSFCLNNRILNLNKTLVVSTTCSGLMCDKSSINEWNNIKGCGCVGMNPNISNLSLVHSIWINAVADMNMADHETVQRRLTHSDFSSTKFSVCYLSSRIPPTVRKSSLSHSSDLFWDLETAIEDVVDFINGNGGWTVVGWYKRGSIKDRSLIESTGGNNSTNNANEDTTVGSGNLNFHVVELLPTNQTLLDKNSYLGAILDAMKFDVSRLTNHS